MQNSRSEYGKQSMMVIKSAENFKISSHLGNDISHDVDSEKDSDQEENENDQTTKFKFDICEK